MFVNSHKKPLRVSPDMAYTERLVYWHIFRWNGNMRMYLLSNYRFLDFIGDGDYIES